MKTILARSALAILLSIILFTVWYSVAANYDYGGGWPSFSDFFVHHFQQRVPHLCVFARVGRDAAWAT
jgi:peptide methionine sulfoxide reductase MsrB